MMKILFAASEIYPYAKTGGLADVADALPKSLQKECDIFTVMPLYSFIDKECMKVFKQIELDLGGVGYDITFYTLDNHFFIEAPLLSTTAHLYGDTTGDYASNDLRFGIFCKAIATLCEMLEIDIAHLNDWHTALSALFIQEKGLHTKTLFTIHNLAYQGIFPKESLGRLGIDTRYFTMQTLEYYGNINFLKAGIALSDAMTTVSPTYAQQILTPEFGCGLDGMLRYHQHKLTGILNGINTDVFDPKSDPNLFCNYDANSLEQKYKNKVAFLKHSTLKDPRKPLFVVLSRLVEQKGIDILLGAMPRILEKKLNLFILGEGSSEEVTKLSDFAQKYPNFEFRNCYDEILSHQAYAAADFLLMPSRFEPCGLAQMIAMRYGVIPIVHATGGLRDSVFEKEEQCGRGVRFEKFSKKEFLLAIDRGLLLRSDDALKHFNMQCDFSFKKSAQAYLRVYRSLV